MTRRMTAVGVTALVAVAAPVGLARAATPPGPVPVEDAAVIAGGLLEVPGGEVVWSLGFGVVPPEEPVTRTWESATAIVVNSGGAVVSMNGLERYLQYPAATVAPAGAEMVIDARPVVPPDPVGGFTHLAITAGPADPADEEVDVVGEPFTLAAGTYVLDVMYDQINPGETAWLAAGDHAPMMLIVLRGSVEHGGVALEPGDSVAAAGRVELVAVGEEPVVVFGARLGDPVTRAGAPTATTADT